MSRTLSDRDANSELFSLKNVPAQLTRKFRIPCQGVRDLPRAPSTAIAYSGVNQGLSFVHKYTSLHRYSYHLLSACSVPFHFHTFSRFTFQQLLEVGIPIPKQSLKRASLVVELDVAREGKKLGKAKASEACQGRET